MPPVSRIIDCMSQAEQIRQPTAGITITGKYLCLALILLALTPLSGIADDTPAEYRLKAAYIYNFTKFIDWPENRANETHIKICVDASTDIYQIFHQNLSLKSVNKQIIEVIRFSADQDIKSCAILFSGVNAQAGLQTGNGVLTIGESPGFIQQGGMIRFFLESQKLRFEINPDQANNYHISISSKLLRLAKISRIKMPAEEINND